MLMRTDPFGELDRLSDRFRGSASRPAMMPMDAYREADHFVVHFDLPGVEAKGIDLTLEQNVLTVSAERRWEPAEGQQLITSERPQGRFSRQLFLGEGLDTEQLTASYDAGVLTVRIPVIEPAKPRKIRISPAAASADETGSAEA